MQVFLALESADTRIGAAELAYPLAPFVDCFAMPSHLAHLEGATATAFEISLPRFGRNIGRPVIGDLKVYDTPLRAYKTTHRLSWTGKLSAITAHAAGGMRMLQMMQTAIQDIRDGLYLGEEMVSPEEVDGQGNRIQDKRLKARPITTEIIAILVPTQFLDPVEVPGNTTGKSFVDMAMELAEPAQAARCQWVICSSLEVEAIRAYFPQFKIAIAGITVEGAGWYQGSHRGITTPAKAKALGVDAIITGSVVTASPNPSATARAIYEIVHED